MEFRFNLSKNPTSQNDFMTAVQFPLKLAFACTAHKIQGSTIAEPNKVVIDLSSIREPATGYVMASRVQRIEQLYILNKFLSEKIYPSKEAMQELARLEKKALNEIEKQRIASNVLITLNIRSLPKHHAALLNDFQMKAKVIALQETWCREDQTVEELLLPDYDLHLVSHGHGKGVATYFSKDFQISKGINKQYYQMSKVSSEEFDIVNIYCSKGANKTEFLKDLGSLASAPRPCFIVGDFNINFLRDPKEQIIKKILSCGFKQIVNYPTHKAGGLIDHVYIKRLSWQPHTMINFPYYSDHGAISIFKPCTE